MQTSDPSPNDRPRVRTVEVIPYDERGHRSFLLHDPAGFLEAPLQISPAALVLFSYVDGTRTREQVRADFEARTHQKLGAEELEEFLRTMDRALLLDSPHFAEHRRGLELEFEKRTVRPAMHAGAAYSKEPEKLRADLDSWLSTGVAGGRPQGRLRALVAPHIDFHRGGAGYGKAYAALRGRERPDVVVVLGTGHAADEGRFIVCEKSFETPLGALPADRDFIGRLEKRTSRCHRKGLLAHRCEHSIEFQALWLAHLFPCEPHPSIVPILCTSFDDLMRGSGGPQGQPDVCDFLGALRETWLEERRKVLVVAGADLSHVGPRFGDSDRLTPAFLDEVRGRDLAAVEGARSGAADRFLGAVAAHKNRDRICSVGGIYTALHTVGAESGDLLAYDQAADPNGHLAVTFAGLALYGPDRGPGLGRLEPGKRILKQGSRG
jgi:AmmeMemoRadiSam system protein B